jgi:hypothetical protein
MVIEARIAKIVMVASLALFAFVVAFDNLAEEPTSNSSAMSSAWIRYFPVMLCSIDG